MDTKHDVRGAVIQTSTSETSEEDTQKSFLHLAASSLFGITDPPFFSALSLKIDRMLFESLGDLFGEGFFATCVNYFADRGWIAFGPWEEPVLSECIQSVLCASLYLL